MIRKIKKVIKSFIANRYSLFLFIVALCFAALYYKSAYGVKNVVLSSLISTLAPTGIVTSLFSILTSAFMKDKFEQEYENTVKDKIPFMYELDEKGLIGYDTNFPLNKNPFVDDFLQSQTVIIIMNDSKYFYTDNINCIHNRLELSKKVTKVVLVDPDSKETMELMTRRKYGDNKTEKDIEYYKKKIDGMHKDWEKEKKQYQKHSLNIYRHDLWISTAIVVTDKYAMISLYQNSPGKVQVPHLIYERNDKPGSEYTRIKADADKLVKYAEEYMKHHNESTKAIDEK